MFRWYVINTYSGHENKVRQNLLHRVESMSQQDKIRRVVVPTEKAVETKDGQKIEVEKRVLPGYVLVQMEMTDDSWHVVKNTPGVTGFVGGVGHGAERQRPTALSELEVNRLLHTTTTGDAAKPKSRAEFSLGEMVKVTSGALSDFEGEITEVNAEAGRLKVSVSIFERQVPVELAFEDVKKID
jgi:transcriptional antiterminator NusG